jgi:hypothetical protein
MVCTVEVDGTPAQIDSSMTLRNADCKKRLAGELVRLVWAKDPRNSTANEFAAY